MQSAGYTEDRTYPSSDGGPPFGTTKTPRELARERIRAYTPTMMEGVVLSKAERGVYVVTFTGLTAGFLGSLISVRRMRLQIPSPAALGVVTGFTFAGATAGFLIARRIMTAQVYHDLPDTSELKKIIAQAKGYTLPTVSTSPSDDFSFSSSSSTTSDSFTNSTDDTTPRQGRSAWDSVRARAASTGGAWDQVRRRAAGLPNERTRTGDGTGSEPRVDSKLGGSGVEEEVEPSDTRGRAVDTKRASSQRAMIDTVLDDDEEDLAVPASGPVVKRTWEELRKAAAEGIQL
ncbi:hypothetical protein M427DRAFT_53673, partial [Gonapodya prolifera JEL478]